VQLLRSTAEGLRLLVEVNPGVVAGGQQIQAPGLPRGSDSGGFDLPYIAELIGVPPGARVTLSARAENSARIAAIRLQSADSLATVLPSTAGTKLARLAPLGMLRGVPTQALTIYPWAYDAASQTVVVHQRIFIDIRFDGGASSRSARRRDAGSGLYGALLNPPSHGGWKSPQSAQRAAAIAADPSRQWVKVFVSDDGIYRITPSWLDELGIDSATIDPATLQVLHAGEEVRLLVNGAEDGAFDGTDELLFHGRYRRTPSPTGERDHESVYGRTDTYWLGWGVEAGLRYTEQDGAPIHDYEQRDWYVHTSHFEIDRTFDQLAFAPDSLADRWFWQQERPLKVPNADRFSSQTFAGDITGFWDKEVYDARVTVAIHGRTGEGFGDHHTVVKLNNEPLEEAYWAGQISHIVDTIVPSSFLRSSRNRILLQGKADRIRFDELWFNWFRLQYRRWFHAYPGFLDASVDAAPSGHRITVQGFSNDDIVLLDVQRGTQLTGGSVGVFADSLFDITFEDAPESMARYVVADRLSFRTPNAVVDEPSDWRSGVHDADYIILTHPDLIPAAERLAAHRQTGGLRVAVVNSQDVYDEFTHGRFDGDAIGAFIDHAYHEWQSRPAFVLILGDETWDYREIYTGRRGLPLVPTDYYLARRRGYSPSDYRLGLVDGDDLLADLSIGRLAVDSDEEALATVDKIISYDVSPPGGDWRGRSILAANWHTKDEFSGPLNSMAMRFTDPFGLQTERLYATDEAPLPNALAGRFLESLNRGALIANFSGHGSAGSMQYLFSTQESDWGYLTQVRNGGRLPLILALSCLNGMFVDPRVEGLSELFTEHLEGGAIAYISASAISFSSQNSLLSEGIYSQLFAEGETRFGPVLDVAKARVLAAHPSWVDVPQTMQLMGDPAQKLAITRGADYAAIGIELPADPVFFGKTARLTAVIGNHTRLRPTGPIVTVTGTSAEGQVDTLLRQSRAAFAGMDSVQIDWPVQNRGLYRLSLNVTASDANIDIDESNNLFSIDVEIREAPVATPFLPAEGGSGPTLQALTQVSIQGDATEERTEFALASEPSFAPTSTVLSGSIESSSGLATWSLPELPAANPEAPWFWRTRVTRGDITSAWSATRSVYPGRNEEATAAWRQSAQALLLGVAQDVELDRDAVIFAPPPSSFRPAEATRDDGFTVLDLPGAGVLATDGVYLYAKRWFNDASTTYAGVDHFARIGTGFGGSFRGRYYGVFADSTTPGMSATYHDGYLYSESGHLFEIERIDTATDLLDTVQVPDGLLDWRTGQVVADEEKGFGQVLHAMITSDGEQIYNVSMSSHLGMRVGWSVRVFDVDAGSWRLAREFVIAPTETGFGFQWTDGIFADGEFLYLVEFGGQRRIRSVSALDGSFVDEWTSDQDVTRVITGQYDPLNDQVWLGDLLGSGLFRYRRSSGPEAGTLTSNVVGPASSWDAAEIDGDGLAFQVQAKNGDTWEIVAEGSSDADAVLDLSHIDAQRQPELRLVARLDTLSEARLRSWQIHHQPASDLAVADVGFDGGTVKAAIRNRGLSLAGSSTVDLLTLSGRLLATRPIPQLAAGVVHSLQFDDVDTDEPLRVWVRPESIDGDGTNDFASVPQVRTVARLNFRTWPMRNHLSTGDALTRAQGILVEATGSGQLTTWLNGEPLQADSSWLEATGARAVLRLPAGRQQLQARLQTETEGSLASTITLNIDDALAVGSVLVVPNPVGREGTQFTAYLSQEAELTVDVFSVSGRRVQRLGPTSGNAGFVSLSWDGRDNSGNTLAAGTYLYRVTARAGDERATRRGALVIEP
jgi:hypothetical protein